MISETGIFDTHAHYDDEQFDGDRAEVLEKIRTAGVKKVVNIGCNLKSSRASVKMAESVSGFYAAVGIHPSDAGECDDAAVKELRTLAHGKGVVAIGEIGLDYHWNDYPAEIQREAFVRQLELAKELDMPVVIHSREAAAETFDIMKKHAYELEKGGKKSRGVIHCYSGSCEMAMDYAALGYYIGLGGVLTYKNARRAVETAEKIPLQKLVIETDCPYLSPVPNRGKRNDSSNLKYVVEKLCEIRHMEEKELLAVLWENSHSLYGLNAEN